MRDASLIAVFTAALVAVTVGCDGKVESACRTSTQPCVETKDCCAPLLCKQGSCQPADSAGCVEAGNACAMKSECCAGLDCVAGKCAMAAMCKPKDGSCAATVDCCDPLVCNAGVCGGACRTEGMACAVVTDCCDPLVCTMGRCATPVGCRGGGQACAETKDCCNPLVCKDRKCAVQPMCGAVGEGCMVAGDCCNPLLCIKKKCATERSTLTVNVTNSCDNGQEIEYRFFDSQSMEVFPNNMQVYVVQFGKTVKTDVMCLTGNQICLGAGQPMGGLFWGAGKDGKENCMACCYTCSTMTVTYPPLGCK